MERSVALKKLGKLLGKSLGYRVDDKAPNRDEREAAQAQLKAVFADKKQLDERLEARRKAVLEADAEYQEIKAAWQAARDRATTLQSISMRYKFTVGTTNRMFFHVKAQGDSWEDIIAQLTKKEAA